MSQRRCRTVEHHAAGVLWPPITGGGEGVGESQGRRETQVVPLFIVRGRIRALLRRNWAKAFSIHDGCQRPVVGGGSSIEECAQGYGNSNRRDVVLQSSRYLCGCSIGCAGVQSTSVGTSCRRRGRQLRVPVAQGHKHLVSWYKRFVGKMTVVYVIGYKIIQPH